MRKVSARWRDSVGRVNRWITVVEWSNDGGLTWDEAGLVSGSVTASSTSQVRWSMALTVHGAPIGRDGINPFTTRVRIRHGMEGEPLLGMGVYGVQSVQRSTDTPDQVQIGGLSFEQYLIKARFPEPFVLPRDEAKAQLQQLVTNVLSEAVFLWKKVDAGRMIPKITADRDRWAIIDGPRDSPSIARALGARVYVDGDGTWIIAKVPTIAAAPSWKADAGEGGVLITSTEELTRDGVYNMIVASGQSTDGEQPPVGPGIAMDLDPLSLTYALKSPDDGGFGRCPRFHASQMLTTVGQAQTAAEGMLAPYLGLKQQITFDSVHDPSKEPGDVGIVQTPDGPQRVILDAVTYDLLGAPLSCETRTTATRLDGSTEEAPDDEEAMDE